MGNHIADGRQLRFGVILDFLRAVECYRSRDDHTVNIHVGEGLFVEVGNLGIAGTSRCLSSVCHERPHIFIFSYHDDTCMSNLRILLHCVLILFAVIVRAVIRLFFLLCVLFLLWLCFGWGFWGMELDILLCRGNTNEVFDLHTQRHQFITEWFAVAEPRRYFIGERAVSKTFPRECWEGGQLALLQLGYLGTWEGIKHDYESHKYDGYDNQVYDG